MGARRGILIAALLLQPLLALANAPQTSPRPVLRPVIVEAAHTKGNAPFESLRPKMRPIRFERSETTVVVEKVVIERTILEDIAGKQRNRSAEPRQTQPTFSSRLAVESSLRPRPRPKRLKVALLERATRKKGKAAKAVRYKKKGSVCGVKGIRGYTVPRVRGKIKGCGIASPVKVTEIDGVKLTREALIGCDAAKSLYSWVNKSAKPTVGRKGGGLAKIQMIAGYSCRTRNSKRGAKLSEHAKGKAVDIAGFVLKDGTQMSVLRGWGTKAHGSTLRKLHKSACGPFGTVLGPNANRAHRDHFHFDVARYRGSSYCR